MKNNNPVSLVFFLLAVAIVILFFSSVWASGTDIEQETNVTHKGSSSIGIGSSLGDVDINQCRESISMSILVVWQGQTVRLNPWCAAESYDAKGLHRMAALVRCDIDEISKHFTTGDACLEANTIKALRGSSEVLIEPDKDDEDYRQQQQTYLAELESRMDSMESARQAPARVTREIIQQPFLSDEKRAKLQAVLDE